eukprot:5062417-Pleurochrysis_carterae.AAC.1
MLPAAAHEAGDRAENSRVGALEQAPARTSTSDVTIVEKPSAEVASNTTNATPPQSDEKPKAGLRVRGFCELNESPRTGF